jgi:hypothetical protein
MVSLSNQGGPEAHDTLLWFPVPGAARATSFAS